MTTLALMIPVSDDRFWRIDNKPFQQYIKARDSNCNQTGMINETVEMIECFNYLDNKLSF